jgi:uncharacterized protein YqeY
MNSPIKERIKAAQKSAMRSRDKQRLSCLRSILAECKRLEVDERVELSDHRILALMDKMRKQRRDSIIQFEAAGREDLVAVERYEVSVIQEFMPDNLSTAQIHQLIDSAIASTGATSMRDMKAVMELLKPQLQGRADMGTVSRQIRAQLTGHT